MAGKSLFFKNTSLRVDELVAQDSSFVFEHASTASIMRFSSLKNTTVTISGRSILNITGIRPLPVDILSLLRFSPLPAGLALNLSQISIELGSTLSVATSLSLHNASLLVTTTKAARRLLQPDIDYTILLFDSISDIPMISSFSSISIDQDASQCEVISVNSTSLDSEGLHMRFSINRSQCNYRDIKPAIARTYLFLLPRTLSPSDYYFAKAQIA